MTTTGACCRACLTAGRGRHLETLTHAFMTCPAVAPALRWLRVVAHTLLGEAPPLDPLVVLADAPWRWRLVGDALWSVLRVAYLGSVWQLRESQSEHPGPAAVVRAVAATLRHSIMRDAARIDAVHMGAPGHPIPAAWFRGPEPCLEQEEFEAMWPNSGGWYELQAGPPPVHVRLSAEWPVTLEAAAAVHLPHGVPADQVLQYVNPEELALEEPSEEDG